ncbi:MAG: hypothetical protein ACYCYO_03895 [Bacilli bacterium]
MKRLLSSIAVATLVLSTVVPAFAAQATSIRYQSATITLNTKIMSHPDRFTYNNTTYMPIWYVQQVLTQMGVKNAWNGVSHVWNLSAKGNVTGNVIDAKSGLTSVIVNGHEIEAHVPTLVKGDPLHHSAATTFMPIWYVQQVLNRVGMQADVWNGTIGVWALVSLSTLLSGGSSTTGASGVNVNTDFPNAATIARYGGAVNPAPQGVTLAKWEAAVKSAVPAIKSAPWYAYSPLATKTQWYPDPHDIFYNKVFPVKDLTNGHILQRDPLVEVTTVDGSNSLFMGYVYVDEYVGKGINGAGGQVTAWKEEQVMLHSYTSNGVTFPAGSVTEVIPTVTNLGFWSAKAQGFPLMAPPANQGYNFGKLLPGNVYWVAGAGLYAVPRPGWNPLSVSQAKENIQ